MNEIYQDEVKSGSAPGEGRPRKLLFSSVRFIEAKSLWIPGLLVLLFFGALFWAKANDPYKRIWFTLKPENCPKAKAVAVLPKPIRPGPIVIFAHNRGETLLSSGVELRQMAEMGMATINFEYDQNSRDNFNAQFLQLHRFLQRQSWARTNDVAWIGAGLGAELMLQFALENRALQPQMMIQLGGKWFPDLGAATTQSNFLKSQVWLFHGENDNLVSETEVTRLRDFLVTNGVTADLRIVRGQQHDFEPDRTLLFRVLGEHCLQVLGVGNALGTYRSIALWNKNAKPLLLYWIPAIAWIGLWIYVKRRNRSPAPNAPLAWWEKGLRFLAVFLVVLALGRSAIHLLTPRFQVSPWTLSIAEKFLIIPKWRGDFDAVKHQSYWSDERLKTLLTHVELSNYNRELINWRVDDPIYREFVLSPVITGDDKELNWRRPLWESFYPRIRKENSIFSAAQIIVRHLRERVTISGEQYDYGIEGIWFNQITDVTGFEMIYVAAMRSAGIAARLNAAGRAEFWDDVSWQLAPRPAIEQLDKP